MLQNITSCCESKKSLARLPAILGRRLSADKKLTSERYYDESTGILAVSENDSRQLVMIDEALQRIEDEEYGTCLNCAKEIMPKRLQAVPWARYCLDCQELVEKGLIEEEE